MEVWYSAPVVVGVMFFFFFCRCSFIRVSACLALAPSYSFWPTPVEDVMKMTV